MHAGLVKRFRGQSFVSVNQSIWSVLSRGARRCRRAAADLLRHGPAGLIESPSPKRGVSIQSRLNPRRRYFKAQLLNCVLKIRMYLWGQWEGFFVTWSILVILWYGRKPRRPIDEASCDNKKCQAS